MQASKFLAMSKSEFYVVVMNGYAIHYELDGSVALFETSSLSDGIYDQDYIEADEEIIKFYNDILAQPMGKSDVRTMSKNILAYMEKIPKEATSKISELPKFTKAIAEGLTKINELATFYVESEIKFLCFGTRSKIVDYLEEMGFMTFTCSPLNLYYSSNFKGDLYGAIVPAANLILTYNEERTCGGIIFSIDINKFEQYRSTNV